MSESLLILDPGSSSLKFGMYAVAHGSDPVLEASGVIERLGFARAELNVEVVGQDPVQEAIKANSFGQAVELVLGRLEDMKDDSKAVIAGVGCRVVHGGDRFLEPTRVTAEVIKAIRALAPLAPLHNPPAAEVLETCMRLLPDVPVAAVFDTSFHQTLPLIARIYALPNELCEKHHIRRYGFHGTAHKYVSGRLLEAIGKAGTESRCITCHLGNGASICAVRNGNSIDTTMGMTPMEGLVMGTRSGDVDPGIPLYLMREAGMTQEEVDDLLNHKSGLLGISGISSDLRDLENAAAQGDKRAELAMEVFAYRAAKYIGACTVALEGLDAIAFSGGIGEHSSSMRERICRLLRILGVSLDNERNCAAKGDEPMRISSDAGRVQAWVIPANENLQIARETRELLAGR